MKIRSIQSLGQPDIGTYYRAATEKCKEEVNDYSAQKILGTDTTELVHYLVEKYKLAPIELDEERSIEYEKSVKKEQVQGHFGDIYTKDIVYAHVIFPLKAQRDLAESFKYHTQTHTLTHYDFDYDDRNFTVSMDFTPETLEKEVSEIINLFKSRTSELLEKTTILQKDIENIVARRKEQVEKDDELFESLVKKVTIPLKRKSEQDLTIPLSVKKDLVELASPKPREKSELVLTSEQVTSILDVINSSGLNFENTPATFSKLEEPDLRNIILSHLNLYFPDDATGETFVGIGKSDIRLKVYEGQILIAECKYWHGEKEFRGAVEQLFGYLTWRRNYGILIVFSRNKDFSDILEKIKKELSTHSSFKGKLTEITPTHIKSMHTFPSDSAKSVEIRTLIYNLYS